MGDYAIPIESGTVLGAHDRVCAVELVWLPDGGVDYKMVQGELDSFRQAWKARMQTMATSTQLIAQISQKLLDELTEGGTRDLTQVRLVQMEQEVYQLADRISQRLLQGMLEDQAGQDDSQCCPCCHSPLQDRPPNRDPVKMQRCDVAWDKPVKRCPQCRRDFFPSVGDVGVSCRGDL